MTLFWWEARSLALFLVAAPALTLGISLVMIRVEDQATSGVAVLVFVIAALMPFAASSCFASEKETGADRFWDFVPVSRFQRYLAKWSALIAVMVAAMLITTPPAIYLLDDVHWDWIPAGCLMFPPLIIAGAFGGQLTGKSVGGGLFGIVIVVFIFVLSTCFLDASSFQWPARIVAGAVAAALLLELPWFHARHFHKEDPTLGRRYWVLQFLKSFVAAFCVGLSLAAIVIVKVESKMYPITDQILIALLGAIPLILIFSLFLFGQKFFSVMIRGLGALIITGILAMTVGSLREGTFTRSESIFLVGALTLCASITFFLLLRSGRFLGPCHATVAAILLPLLPLIGAFIAVVSVFGLSNITIATESAPVELKLQRSTDQAAIDRSRRLFTLAAAVGDPPAPSAIDDVRDILAEGSLAYLWPEQLGPEMPFPRFFALISIAKAMEAKSQNEKAEKAAQTIADIFSLGREIRKDGPLIQYLVGVTILNRACATAETWLRRAGPSENGITIVADAVRRSLQRDGAFRQAMAAEIEYAVTGIDHYYPESNLNPYEKIFLPLLLNEKDTLEMLRRRYVTLIEYSQKPYPSVKDDLEKLNRAEPKLNPTNILGEIMIAIAAPKLTDIVKTQAALDAKLKGLDLALRARASKKSFPEFWDSLPAWEKENPFTGESFAISDSPPAIVVTTDGNTFAYAM